MMNIFALIKKRYQRIVYTIRHKAAFLKVEKKLLGHNTLRGYLHDWDKPFLFCIPWLSKKEIQNIHRRHNKHHVVNTQPKTKADYIETIIDWECARYTKPDKPLNAYETLMTFYASYAAIYLPIIQELLPHQLPEKITDNRKIQEVTQRIESRVNQ